MLFVALPEIPNTVLLSCKSYQLAQVTMFKALSPIFQSQLNKDISTVPRSTLISILLFGSEDMDYKQNTKILNKVVKFIIKSKKLDTQ